MNAVKLFRILFHLIPAFLLSWFLLYLYECYIYTPISSHQPSKDSPPPYPASAADNLFWFIHISDLHLSIKVDPGGSRYRDLRVFCTENVKTINPSFILVTGDLTDAKEIDQIRSQQFREEWDMYSALLENTGILEHYPWLDLRGNHDAFDVLSYNHSTNFYRSYRKSYTHHSAESYIYLHTTEFGKYAFVGLDACPSLGPRRPFNFFGVIDDEDYTGLSGLLDAASGANHTVWFAHYPTAIITTEQQQLRELLKTSTAYLCGHLHDLGGVMLKMYGRHRDGHLELELADWKFRRWYRVMAVDHDLVSFVDVQLGQWPVILVTNPKDSKFYVPRTEPLSRIRKSTHIRMLIFTPSSVKTVRVFINGRLVDGTPVHAGGPLYVLPWQPEKFSSGQHHLAVSAEDSEGRVSSVSHTFSVDGSVGALEFFPNLLLLGDIAAVFRLLFFTMWLSVLGGLFSALLSSARKGPWSTYRHIAGHKHLHISLCVQHVLFGTGPWCMAELLTGTFGWMFPHGLLISGVFIPGSLTYLYGSLLLLFSTVPFLSAINLRLSPHHKQRGVVKRAAILLLALFAIGCYARGVWSLYYPYGFITLLVGPGTSWTLCFYVYLFVKIFILLEHAR